MAQLLTNWLKTHGIVHQQKVLHNPDRSILLTEALLNGEGELTHDGALAVSTTPYTGRSPNDKYIVGYEDQDNLWWGNVNQRMSPDVFKNLKSRMTGYLSNRTLYVIDAFIGADPKYQQSVRIITEYAWQAIASINLLLYSGATHTEEPDMVIFAAPGFQTEPEIDKVKSLAAIAIDLKQKMVLIAGSKYVGEIKKSAFTIMNAILPESNVLPMHCSANVGEDGDVALYFGLSGTGKTALSSTPDRRLIGDDEHGWGANGVFNFEGGCYAKTLRLNPEHEPIIWKAIHHYGTILENVVMDPETRQVDFDNGSVTENARGAYPLTYVDNYVPSGKADHPSNIFFLSADAFGVVPPIAKLNPKQAIYYFLSGYTSKVAGTERGLGQMPKATFSTCFGEPFLPLTPNIYADLLRSLIRKHNCNIWLVNTGWTGGNNETGKRMHLPHTRRMINWVLSGEHLSASFHIDPTFNLPVPDQIPGIPEDLFYPERTWKDQRSFLDTAQKLKQDFEHNFEKFKEFL